MTHLARVLVSSLVVLTSCTAEVITESEVASDRLYDFSPRRLDAAPAPLPPPGASAKRQIVFALGSARTEIASCLRNTNHPAGTVDVTLFVELDPVTDAYVDGALVEAFGDVSLAQCIRDAWLATDVTVLDTPETAERWTIRAPLVVDANYTGKL
ncbi:MAG: hypothetical protein H0T46_03560 [Deltaproteobacteria bacterium]|nr:hypothetical protein [Deltaproteobacteria bacterium]